MAKKSLGSVESLISASWKRTRERFLSYFLATLLTVALFFAVVIGGFIASLVIGLLATAMRESVPIIGVVLSGVVVVGVFIGALYVFAWSALAAITTVINKEKIGVIEAFKKVKPLVPRFMGVQILIGLFTIGLIPLSLILLFIPMIVWYLWLGFVPFVYLDQKKSGLENLWISREMVNQNFWGVLGRRLLFFIAIMFFGLLIGSSRNTTLVVIWQLINFLFIAPFIVSYEYEIYSQLEKKTSAPTSKLWVMMSVVGFILIVLLGGAIIKKAQEIVPAMLQKQQNQQLNKQFEMQYQQQMQDELLNNVDGQPAETNSDL